MESYIIEKLCWEKAVLRKINNIVVNGPRLAQTFELKKLIINENCELTHYLDFKYASVCNFYVSEVLSVKGLIRFFMLSKDLHYIIASKFLNIPIPTAYKPIPATPIKKIKIKPKHLPNDLKNTSSSNWNVTLQAISEGLCNNIQFLLKLFFKIVTQLQSASY